MSGSSVSNLLTNELSIFEFLKKNDDYLGGVPLSLWIASRLSVTNCLLGTSMLGYAKPLANLSSTNVKNDTNSLLITNFESF
jgi:hypothetical protein